MIRQGRIPLLLALALAVPVAGAVVVTREDPRDTTVATHHPAATDADNETTTSTVAAGEEAVVAADTTADAPPSATTKPRPESPTTAPSLVPAGLFARIEGTDLVVSTYDGSGRRVLVPGTNAAPVWAFGWSPDEKLMGYLRGPKPAWNRSGNPEPPMSSELGVVRTDGSLVRVIDRDHQTATYVGCCTWSPDGSRLVYRNNSQGQVVARVAGGGPVAFEGDGAVWSPDGQWVAFGASRDFSAVQIADRDGGNVHEVAADGRDFAWSPDSTKLVYLSAPGTTARFHTVSRDGSGDMTLFPIGTDDQSWATWSPDGAHLMVERATEIWTVAPDGSEPHKVTGGHQSHETAQWLSNDRVVAFDEGRALMIASISNGARVHLTRGPVSTWLLTTTKDWVLYTGWNSEVRRLHAVATRGAPDIVLVDELDGGYFDTPDGSAAMLPHTDGTGGWSVIRIDGRGRWRIPIG